MDLEIEGLDASRVQLQQQLMTERVAYVCLYRRDGGPEVKLARLDLDDLALDGVPRSPEERTEALMDWVREQVTADYQERPPTDGDMRLRLRLYGPKGLERLGQIALVVRQSEDLLTDVVPHEEPPRTRFPQTARAQPRGPTDGIHRVMHDHLDALGNAHQNFTSYMMVTMAEYVRVSRQQADGLAADLARARAQTDRLLAALVSTRLDAVEAREKDLGRQQAANQEALVRDIVREVRETAQTLTLGAQGLPAETAELLRIVQQVPELGGLLQDPTLREALANPQSRALLFGMLQQLLGQLKGPGGGIPPVPNTVS